MIDSWPAAIFSLGVLLVVGFLIALFAVGMFEMRKAKLDALRADDLRQLVRRFEQLAENTMDAQQRTAADLAELRARTTSIEQILRTVE
ncbi:hypothetical protein ACFPOI_34730 [Nonomuraea angiospora]|uniref:Tfp pilus assembly protein PilO n=1 Tax=Nonomuraea angiospora TaxID=46172 RepID=A0ABR9M834_9ACTN|nr:hypothetical protein [Nonomuraea angiospora]MBE1589070.1 Tfp pilus assembly protein PilO [Nonomuraea angiospora]